MATLEDIRRQFPQAAGMSDSEIITKMSEAGGLDPKYIAGRLGVDINPDGFKSGLKRGLAGMVGGVGEVVGDATGRRNNALTNFAKDVEFRNPSEINSLQDVLDKPGTAMASALGNAASFLIPGGGLKLGAAGLRAAKAANTARAIDNPLTQAAVAGLPSLGEIGDSQREQGVDNPWAKYGGALAVGAVENLGGVQRVLGFGGQQARRTAAQEVAGFGNTPWKTALKTTGRMMGQEGLEEVAQTPIEQVAGYRDPTTAQALEETALGGVMGTLGGVIGAGHGVSQGVRHARIQRGIATDMLDPSADYGRRRELGEFNQAFMARSGDAGAQQWFDEFNQGAIADRDAARFGAYRQVYDGRMNDLAAQQMGFPDYDAYLQWEAVNTPQGTRMGDLLGMAPETPLPPGMSRQSAPIQFNPVGASGPVYGPLANAAPPSVQPELSNTPDILGMTPAQRAQAAASPISFNPIGAEGPVYGPLANATPPSAPAPIANTPDLLGMTPAQRAVAASSPIPFNPIPASGPVFGGLANLSRDEAQPDALGMLPSAARTPAAAPIQFNPTGAAGPVYGTLANHSRPQEAAPERPDVLGMLPSAGRVDTTPIPFNPAPVENSYVGGQLANAGPTPAARPDRFGMLPSEAVVPARSAIPFRPAQGDTSPAYGAGASRNQVKTDALGMSTEAYREPAKAPITFKPTKVEDAPITGPLGGFQQGQSSPKATAMKKESKAAPATEKKGSEKNDAPAEKPAPAPKPTKKSQGAVKLQEQIDAMVAAGELDANDEVLQAWAAGPQKSADVEAVRRSIDKLRTPKAAEQILAEKAKPAPVEITEDERIAAGHVKVVKDGQVSWLTPEEIEKRKTQAATTDRPRVAPEDIEDQTHAKAVKMFLAGDSMRAIGKAIGTSHETARTVLLGYGYTTAQRDKEAAAGREAGKAYATDDNASVEEPATAESVPLGLEVDDESETTAADMSADMSDDYSNNDEVVDRDLELGGITVSSKPNSGAAVAATADSVAKRAAERELARRREADPQLFAEAGNVLRNEGLLRKGERSPELWLKAMDVLAAGPLNRKAKVALQRFAKALRGEEDLTKLELQEAQEEEAADLAREAETLGASVEKIIEGDVDAVMATLELLNGENGPALRRRLIDQFGMPNSYNNEQIVQYFMELHEEAEARMQPLVEEAATLWGEGFDGLTPAQQRAFATDLMNIGDLKYDTRVLRQLREEINGQVGRSEEGGGQVEVGPAAGRDEGRTAEEGAQPDAVSGPGESSKGPVVKVRKRRTVQRDAREVAPESVSPDDVDFDSAPDAPTTSARRIEPLTGRRTFVRAMVGLRNNLPKSPTLDADLRKNLVAGNVKGALDAIANGGSSVAARQLAKKVSALMTGDVRVEVVEPGKYYPEGVPNILASAYGVAEIDRDNKRVTIYLRSDVGVNEETVLHEALHAALQSRYDFLEYGDAKGKAGEAALAQFKGTWAAFQTEVSRATGELPVGVREAARSPDEFITYALTNPETQAWMQSRRYRGQTLWERFKNFVASVLGFRSAPSWLDAAMRVSNELLEGAAQDKADFSASDALTGRSAVSPQLLELADRYGPTAAKAVTDTSNILRKAGDSMLFLHDLVDKYKAALPSSGAWYKAVQGSIARKHQLEQDAEQIALRAAKPGVDMGRVNDFISRSTFEQKWGYDATFDGVNGPKSVKADPAMAAEFKRLSADEQQIVKDVFAHGEKMATTKFKLLKDLGLTGNGFLTMGKLDGPYAPLKRFGNYVSVGKSQQLADLEAKRAEQEKNGAKTTEVDKQIQALKADPAHYIVSYHATPGLAREEAKARAAKYAFTDHFEKSTRVDQDRKMPQEVFQKIIAAVNAESLPGEVKEAMRTMVEELYVGALDEHNARTSGLKRENRAGYDPDMMKAFLSHARAEANFLANIEFGPQMNEQFFAMQNEAKDEGGKRSAQDAFNEFGKHYAENLTYRETPWQDRAMALTSAWQLATSVGYHVTNATQGVMVTVPKLAADFGDYAGAWRHMMDGYRTLATTGVKNLDLSKVRDAGLRDALQRASDMGVLDVGMDEDLTQFDVLRTGYAGVDKASSVARKALHALRQMSRWVETANRVSAATAAYRMAREKGRSVEEAQDYAVKILQSTQGDFSRVGAPLLLKKLPKPMTQYRKYQFMMGALYAKAFSDAFGSADADTKAAGRRMLKYKLAHTAFAAGALGLPLMNLATLVFAAGGDDDEPRDLERWLRDTIGDETLADLLLHGVPAMAGVDMHAKLGDDKIFSITPYTEWDLSSRDGFAKTLVGFMGPAAAQGATFADGVGKMQNGDYYKGLEQFMPKGIKDGMAAFRVANEGYTLTNGDVMVGPEDISGFSLAANALGLPSTEVKKIQWLRGQQYEAKQFFTERTREIQRGYARAVEAGDDEALAELRDAWMALQDGKDKIRPYFNNSPDELRRQALSTLLKYPQKVAERERKLQASVPE